MGALRFDIIATDQLCGPQPLVPFRVYLDCWQARIWLSTSRVGRGDAYNWLVSMGGGAPVNVGAFANGQDGTTRWDRSNALQLGGMVHQLGARATPANMNTYMDFTPKDPTGLPVTMTIVRVYYDEGVIDPDFPG